jgi:quercetin dioxygenase-like cupin family protein
MRGSLEVTVVSLFVVSLSWAGDPPAVDAAVVAQLATATFKPLVSPGVPEGVQLAVIAGDPKKGASVVYAKFAPGLKFPVHSHSAAEFSTLVSGKVTLTIEGVAHELVPGAYTVIPAKTKHSVTCAPGAECVLLIRRPEAVDFIFPKS